MIDRLAPGENRTIWALVSSCESDNFGSLVHTAQRQAGFRTQQKRRVLRTNEPGCCEQTMRLYPEAYRCYRYHNSSRGNQDTS